MRKFLKLFLLLAVFQLSRISAFATENLPFNIIPGTIPDPIEGYGVPFDIFVGLENVGPGSYTLPADFLRIWVVMPIGLDLEISGTLPAGFAFVSFASEGEPNAGYITNSSELSIAAGDVYEFYLSTTPEEAYEGEDMIIDLQLNDDLVGSEYDYEIAPVDGVTSHIVPINVPNMEIDPLSVDFVAVYTEVEDCTVNVNWKVSATDAASYEGIQYAVERSFRGSQFEQIAVITPQAGQFSMNYGDKDAQEGVNLYRIKQISIDGQVTYSYTVRADVTCTPAQNIKIYPNPAVDFVSISGVKAGQKVRVFGINGVEIYSIDVQQDNQVIQVNDLPAGAYNVNVLQNGTSVFNGKLIKR